MPLYGYAGKILRVNFTTGSVSTESTEKYKDYVGGNGIGYKVIFDEVPLDTHPHDEASKLVIAVGPLTATGIPCSGRTTITCLSSWSKGFSVVDGHMGGHFAHALKYAGYDAVIIEGKSSKPVYLKIDDDKVSIEDASHIWGKGTFEANRKIVEACGEGFTAASIGLAGENLVNMSSIITSFGNSAGAGCGAVFGSKKIKGIAVRGTGSVKIADIKKLREVSTYMLKELIGGNNNHIVPAYPQSWAEYSAPSNKSRWSGAPGLGWQKAPGGFVDMGEQPPGDINKISYRAHKGHFDFGKIADKYMVKIGGCSSCPIRCFAEYDVDPLSQFDLPTKTSNTCMPLVSVSNWYAGNIDKMEHVSGDKDGKFVNSISGARAVDEYGLWDNYGQIQRDFANLYNEGILKEKLPKEEYDSIPWDLMEKGDPRWIWEIVSRIASNKGEIATLGMGTLLMCEKWGLDHYMAEEHTHVITVVGFATHHGPTESGQVSALYNMVFNRDCMVHHTTCVLNSGAPYEVQKKVMEHHFGEGCWDAPKKYTPINENKVKVAKWAATGKNWHDSATLCNWMYPMTMSPVKNRNYIGDLDLDAQYMTAVTGENWTRADVEKAAEKITTLLRAITALSYNINLGSTNLRKDHDAFHDWIFDDKSELKAFEEGSDKLNRADMEKAVDMFYEAMGWDKETGIPTKATLERLGLTDVAAALEKRGILPA